MKIFKALVLCAACCAAFSLSLPDDAEARRLGGGRSFGGASRLNRPAPAPKAPGGATVQQPGSTVNRQAPGAAGGATALSRPGRFGGIFTGLLAGSLIGSLLMGSGFAGAGLLDIVLIGGLIYFVLRLFRRSGTPRNGDQTSEWQNRGDARQAANPVRGSGQGASSWDRLRDDSLRDTGRSVDPISASVDGKYEPAWSGVRQAHKFDQEEFLRGAKLVYVRLQESWDKRDLDDIAEFATPAVLDVLREQMREEPDPSVTELLLINAEFLNFEPNDDGESASVLFDVLMREDPAQDDTEQVREIWHFIKQKGGMWKLDGIQQVR